MNQHFVWSWKFEGLTYQRQAPVPVVYKGHSIGEHRLDLLVEDRIIVELKSVERPEPLFEAQILTYLRISRKKIGLLINFNSKLLTNGVRRFIL